MLTSGQGWGEPKEERDDSSGMMQTGEGAYQALSTGLLY